jgi:hypothetical protein
MGVFVPSIKRIAFMDIISDFERWRRAADWISADTANSIRGASCLPAARGGAATHGVDLKGDAGTALPAEQWPIWRGGFIFPEGNLGGWRPPRYVDCPSLGACNRFGYSTLQARFLRSDHHNVSAPIETASQPTPCPDRWLQDIAGNHCEE